MTTAALERIFTYSWDGTTDSVAYSVSGEFRTTRTSGVITVDTQINNPINETTYHELRAYKGSSADTSRTLLYTIVINNSIMGTLRVIKKGEKDVVVNAVAVQRFTYTIGATAFTEMPGNTDQYVQITIAKAADKGSFLYSTDFGTPRWDMSIPGSSSLARSLGFASGPIIEESMGLPPIPISAPTTTGSGS